MRASPNSPTWTNLLTSPSTLASAHFLPLLLLYVDPPISAPGVKKYTTCCSLGCSASELSFTNPENNVSRYLRPGFNASWIAVLVMVTNPYGLARAVPSPMEIAVAGTVIFVSSADSQRLSGPQSTRQGPGSVPSAHPCCTCSLNMTLNPVGPTTACLATTAGRAVSASAATTAPVVSGLTVSWVSSRKGSDLRVPETSKKTPRFATTL
mmetsp:Transcript_31816/g.76271  ORF Transcript_31816/g.76271 Transcript_31816/m.76271 type:complete len:209 (+) Transcript_31816:980-1606(+)